MLFLLGASSFADIIPVGVLSYDVFIPGAPGAPGVNVFNVSNNTGDPFTGGFALPPDFPVVTSLTLLNAELLLGGNGAPSSIALGDIAPGPLPLASTLEFPDTATFTSAAFSATLNTTSLTLSDGTIIILDSPSVSATLLPPRVLRSRPDRISFS